MQKKWGTPKERMPFPVSLSSHPSSFRAQREIFLAQRSNGERQMRSSRSTHAILSLPHKYRVPLRRKRSLGYARDEDTRERAISHGFSSDHVEGCPCGADLSSAFGAPLLQGAALLACKNAICERNQYSLKYENTASLTFPFTPLREPTSAPSGHLLPTEGGNIHTIPRTKAFPAWVMLLN